MLRVPPPPILRAAAPLTYDLDTGYGIMGSLISIWNGTDAQARKLSSLTYPNGSPIITPTRKDVIREVVGMLETNGYDFTLDFLSNASSPDYILWEQPSMDDGRDKVSRELTIQQAEEKGVKDVGKCRYCASTELVFATKQLRSGDEPATIFVRCVMCQKQWKG